MRAERSRGGRAADAQGRLVHRMTDAPAALLVASGCLERSPNQRRRPLQVGRRGEADLQVPGPQVSRARIPPLFGPAWPTVYRRFARWSKDRVWARLHRVILDELGAQGDLDWSRFAIDSVSVRALEGGC